MIIDNIHIDEVNAAIVQSGLSPDTSWTDTGSVRAGIAPELWSTIWASYTPQPKKQDYLVTKLLPIGIRDFRGANLTTGLIESLNKTTEFVAGRKSKVNYTTESGELVAQAEHSYGHEADGRLVRDTVLRWTLADDSGFGRIEKTSRKVHNQEETARADRSRRQVVVSGIIAASKALGLEVEMKDFFLANAHAATAYKETGDSTILASVSGETYPFLAVEYAPGITIAQVVQSKLAEAL